MSEVIVEKKDGILELRLDRPAKRNALTSAMYQALTDAMRAADEDAAVRAIVFTANGETFCGGNDVHDFIAAASSGETPAALHFIEALVGGTKPLVAAVHGPAVGIGATMLLHCDLVYASPAARLLMQFVDLGLVPEAGSSLLLPRRVGHAVAAEILLLGKPVEAARAKDLGLVNEIVDASELRAHALARATELARQPPKALALARALLRGSTQEVSARIAEEGAHFLSCLRGPEAREALSAFLERRRPDFSRCA